MASAKKLLTAAALPALLVVAAAGLYYRSNTQPAPAPTAVQPPAIAPASALQLVLTPQRGTEPIDTQIAAAQGLAAKEPAAKRDPRSFEKLGWLFVQKARLSNDPGYYRLAEQCAIVIAETEPTRPDALLLRGHALEAMHRFREAEAVARQLVAQREYVLDYGLLGDALMEQGRVDDAVVAYQQMADLKPCLQVFTRVAHVRWLKGDLDGAIEMADEAAHSGTTRDPEPLVWAMTKLSVYTLAQGDLPRAKAAAAQALALQPHYAAALLQRGRIRLAEGDSAAALTDLQEAAQLNPLPEPQWALADALRAAGQEKAADEIEAQLTSRGAVEDPRSFALYLATRGQKPDEALRLARRELEQRQDVFTHDAVAWACFANRQLDEAGRESALALGEGTKDARLFLHAGLIAAARNAPDAATFLNSARAAQQTLLPSERALLDRALATAVPVQSTVTKNP